MHDIRALRETPELFDKGWAARGMPPQTARLIALDDERRAVVSELQAAQEKRNALSKEIGLAKRDKDEARAAALMNEVASLKELEGYGLKNYVEEMEGITGHVGLPALIKKK
jgi:seryl-tRNA synthetase